MTFVVQYYDAAATVNKWKQLQLGVLYVDPYRRSIWHRSHKPPMVVIYYSGQGAVRKAIVVSGTKQEAFFISNTGSPTAQDLALFTAQLASAGIIANPNQIVTLNKRACPAQPRLGDQFENKSDEKYSEIEI